MSIERGRDWGERTAKPPDLIYAGTDREASALISDARRRDDPLPAVGLLAGDMHRTLGGTPQSGLRTALEGTRVTVDLGAALIDGKLHWFLAHLVARRPWFRGRTVAVANAAFLGSWNIAPRAHPGDGHLDVVEAELGVRDRLKARRRLPAGTHVPHPDITVRRAKAAQFEFERPLEIRLDGSSIGRARSLSIRTEPDGVEIWI